MATYWAIIEDVYIQRDISTDQLELYETEEAAEKAFETMKFMEVVADEAYVGPVTITMWTD